MSDTGASRRPILVTGAHRSGTTWVGKMLVAGGQTAYISEPLNIYHRKGVLISPTKYWYTYICAGNEDQFLEGLHQTLAFRYHLFAEILTLRSSKDLGRMVRDAQHFMRSRCLSLRPLIKDPFAVFSAPWFADRFGCQIVITVRHPAAFVSSLKRLNWPFDLNDLLEQPLLMRDLLATHRQEIEAVVSSIQDPIVHNSLLWRLIYQTVQTFQKQYPEFIIVRHEDLSLQPLERFRALYNELQLDFSDKAQKTILTSSSPDNPAELTNQGVHSVQLNSMASLENWKRRLTSGEIDRIRELTAELAADFYPEWSWG